MKRTFSIFFMIVMNTSSSRSKLIFIGIIVMFAAILTVCSTLAQVQTVPPQSQASQKNAIYLEGNGNALTFSLNYEREVAPSLHFRVGLGVLAGQVQSSGGDVMAAGIPVPLMLNYLIGQAHALELGVGTTMFVGALQARRLGSNENVNFAGVSFIPTSTIGYRYRSEESGFMLRLGVMPYYVGDVIAGALIGNPRRVQGFLGNPVLSASGFGYAVGVSLGWAF
jgi:hypothetical protein